MSNLTNQDKAYFLMASRGNAQHHINVSSGRAQETNVIIINQQPQVPVLYQTGYSNCSCCNDTKDDIEYRMKLIEEGVKAPFEGIADIIRAANGLESKTTSTSAISSLSTSSNTGSCCNNGYVINTNCVSSYEGIEDSALKARQDDFRMGMADLEEQLNDLRSEIKTRTTPSSSSPSSDTENEASSDVAKKWSKVDIGYNKAQVDAYLLAAKSGNAQMIGEYKPQLILVQSKAKKGLEEINKALEDENLSKEDKKVLDAAKKELDTINNQIKNALDTEVSKADTNTPTSSTPATTTPATTTPATTTPVSSMSISDAKQAAEAAQRTYNDSKTSEDQINAIQAYNNYARAVLKDPNATLGEISACINSLNVVCSCNKSPYVMKYIKSNTSITDIDQKPAADLLADLRKKSMGTYSMYYGT